MYALLRKELNSFFSSITGYIVITVFLLSIGLFIWIFPGTDYNILESGYSSLDGLFILAPWLFMFLIPAITMRTFAEEQKTGTIEILLTKPLSDFKIVFAKYFAGFLLVVFSILPTIVYYFTVYYLASPTGNIDTAGITGSYVGLLLLASGFVSIGVFSSSLSSNQIVSFIVALILSLFFYAGFDFFSSIPYAGVISNILSQLGISQHYASLSRGVIDTHDIVYFLSLTLLFLFLSKFILEKRKW